MDRIVPSGDGLNERQLSGRFLDKGNDRFEGAKRPPYALHRCASSPFYRAVAVSKLTDDKDPIEWHRHYDTLMRW